MSVAKIWLETVTEHMITRGISMSLAAEAQPALSRVPEWWNTPQGDGRGRSGRETVWPVSDIILTVKVSFRYLIKPESLVCVGWLALTWPSTDHSAFTWPLHVYHVEFDRTILLETGQVTEKAEVTGRTVAQVLRERPTLSLLTSTSNTECMYKRDGKTFAIMTCCLAPSTLDVAKLIRCL